MLTPKELELLTASVDGELDARQRRACARLLRTKPEARKLLAELKGDSCELQALPPVPAPPGLHASITQAVSALPAPRARKAIARPAARAVPLWVGYATAAAVLLAVGLGSFLLHWAPPGNTPRQPPAVAHQGREPGVIGHLPREVEEPTGPGRPEPPIRIVEEMPPPRIVTDQDPDDPEEAPVLPQAGPERRPGQVLASGQTEPLGRLERVEVALPHVHILHGLDVPEQRAALRRQLGSASAVRVEIPARDPFRGLERVRAALTSVKANVLIEPSAAARLKKPVARTDFAIYLEGVTPEDLTEVLRTVGMADRAAGQKRAVDLCFEGPLVVKELTRWDRRDLTDLLGVDPLRDKPEVKSRPVDIRKPLGEDTASKVEDALSGKGPPRPGSQAHGIVLPMGLPRVRSAELKKFLESRPAAIRPGTLKVFLVVRAL
jgi:hypothetical protein